MSDALPNSGGLGRAGASRRLPGASMAKLAPALSVGTIYATVLFADMRGYTGLAERLPPGRVLFSSTVAAALGTDGRNFGPTIERPSFLLLPQFALRGRSGLLDIWCAPAPERLPL